MSSRPISLKETDTSFVLNGDLLDNSLKHIAEDYLTITETTTFKKLLLSSQAILKIVSVTLQIKRRSVLYSVTFVTFLSTRTNHNRLRLLAIYFSYTL